MHRCTIVVEGCKFSFWRKFSERRTWTWSLVWFDSGHQAWYGFMRPCAVRSVHCAMCNLQCDMWYVIWLYDALNTLDFHPLHKPRNLTTALWAAPAPVCKNAHDPRPRFPHPHHPLDTQGGLDLQCPRRENICDGHPSCWHWKFTQLPARVGSSPILTAVWPLMSQEQTVKILKLPSLALLRMLCHQYLNTKYWILWQQMYKCMCKCICIKKKAFVLNLSYAADILLW